MYRADVSTYNLARKHQLLNSYEITRSFVFALFVNYIIQAIVVLIQIIFKKINFSSDSSDYEIEGKVIFIVQILWNINHIIFPWSVLLFHRGQRDKLIAVWKSVFPSSNLQSGGLTNFDGKEIVQNPTQSDYFEQMRVAWTVISLGMISISMITMLVTHLLQTLVCLLVATTFEGPDCAELDSKYIFLAIRRYAEAFSLAAQLFLTIERVLSIQFSKLHRLMIFKIIYFIVFLVVNAFSFAYMYTNVIVGGDGLFWLVVFQLTVLANLPFVIYAKQKSKSMYKAPVTTYSLHRKHDLFNFHEIARSLLYSIAIYITAQLVCFGCLWASVAELIFVGEVPKLFFVIYLIWNTNLAAFPWIVMLIHRSQRERIFKIWNQVFKKDKVAPTIRGLNGVDLVSTPTQHDYFNQLQKSWQ